jgi:hypothetical protein
MGDFLVAPSGRYKGDVRCAQELLKVFAQAAFTPNDEIWKAADWMVDDCRKPVKAKARLNRLEKRVVVRLTFAPDPSRRCGHSDRAIKFALGNNLNRLRG